MRSKYFSQLDNILVLRREYDDINKQLLLSRKSIEDICRIILNDDILMLNFAGLANEMAVRIRSIKNYDDIFINKINKQFVSHLNVIKCVWDEYSEVDAYLSSQELFSGLKDKLNEYKEKYHTAKNIQDVKKNHQQVKALLDQKENLDNIINDLQQLTKVLDDLPIFKSLANTLEEHREGVIKAKNIDTINCHYAWIHDLLIMKNDLQKIFDKIYEFKFFVKNSALFSEDKWIASLEKSCVNAESSAQIKKLAKEVIEKDKSLVKIQALSVKCDEMKEYCYSVYDKSFVNENCNIDKNIIINLLLSLESDSRLTGNEVHNILIKLDNKRKYIMDLVNKPYPSVEYFDNDDLWETTGSVFVFFINVFLFIFIWPVIFIQKNSQKASSLERPISDW